MMGGVLPPGPKEPAALQTVEWIARPTAFLRRCRARHGDPFTVRVAWADAPMVLVADLRSAIGFSSFGVLLYYLVANVSALTQERRYRLYPRFVAVGGVIGCVLLVLTLPLPSILTGIAVFAVGAVYRFLCLRGRAAGE